MGWVVGPNPLKVISMFDCPEHNHTSPSMTLERVILLPSSSKAISYGPPAFVVKTSTFHFPESSVLVLYCLLFHDVFIVICALTLPSPQSATRDCCWRTMLLLI